MNQRVVILREAVVKITQMLTGKGITVTQQGINAYVKSDHTGRPILVNLPYLPDNATEELIQAIQGFLDHEVAHVLFSDFSLLPAVNAAGVHGTTNMLEDTFVERKMAERFSGSAYNLAQTGKFFLDKYITPRLQEAVAKGDTNEAAAVLMVVLMRAMAGQQVFKEYLKDKMHMVQPIYDKIKDLEPRIAGLQSSKDCFETAKEIEARLRGKNSGAPQPKQQSGKGAETKVEGGTPGKGKGKGKGEGEKGSPEASAPQPPATEEEEGEEGEGAGEGEESKGEPKEEKGKPEKSESEPEGEGESESASGEGEGEEGEEESAGSEGEESESEGSAEMETVFDSALLSALDKESANSYDASMSRLVSDAAADAAAKASYLPFTRDFDKVEPLRVGRDYRPAMFATMADRVDHMVGPLQKDLERAIAARSLAVWESGRRSGRLHAANLSRLATGDARVFRRRHESTSKDVAVSLVIDCSGSMSGAKIHLASQAAYALSSVLERLRIDHEVIAFTTGDMPGKTMADITEEQKKMGRGYSRVESLYMPIIKGFPERLSTDVRERFGWLPNANFFRNNIDGECVEIAARRLMTRPEKGKIMIVLSDGAPAGYGDRGALSRHLQDTVKSITAQGIKTVGLGIMSAEVQRYYPKNILVNDVNELPTRVIKELRQMLLQPH